MSLGVCQSLYRLAKALIVCSNHLLVRFEMAEGADQVCHLGQGGTVGLLQEPVLHLREALIGRRQVPNRRTRVTGIVRAKIGPRNPGQLVGIIEGH